MHSAASVIPGNTRFLVFVRDNARWLGAGLLLAFLSSFGQTYFISVFAGEIRETFGLSHGGWGGIYTLGTTASAIVMLWAGGLADQFRVRVIGVIVLLGLAAACLAMAAVPSVFLLPVVIFALRLTGQGMTSHIAMVAMGRWFVATRGRALAIATLGYALGEAFLPLIFTWALTFTHWRVLWVIGACIVLGALPLLLWLLVKERVPQSDLETDTTAGLYGRHWRRGEVLRHWLFWCLVPLVIGPSCFITAFFFLQVHIAETKGWAHLDLVALFPIYTATGIASMFTAGWVVDKVGSGRLLPVVLIPLAISFWVFGTTDSYQAAALAMALMGVSQGAYQTTANAFWPEFFGTRHLGGIKALGASAMVLGSAIGPGLCGALIDAGFPFQAQMIFVGGYFLATSALVGFAIARARAASAGA